MSCPHKRKMTTVLQHYANILQSRLSVMLYAKLNTTMNTSNAKQLCRITLITLNVKLEAELNKNELLLLRSFLRINLMLTSQGNAAYDHRVLQLRSVVCDCNETTIQKNG